MLITLIHVLILEKEGTFSSKERNNTPKEKQSESIKRPHAHKATENDHKLVAW